MKIAQPDETAWWSNALSGIGSRGDPVLYQRGFEYIYAGLVVVTASVFAFDLNTPLGQSEWVFYCIPIVLGFLFWHPIVPLAIALLVTLLAFFGFAFSPGGGVVPDLAVQNRMYGVFTFWVLGGTGYLFIQNKLAVKRQEWLHAGQVRLAESIAGDLPVQQLGERVLKFASEYLGAAAAAVFVQEGAAFKRKATFAVPAKAAVPDEISAGDGFLGQAVTDARSFYVRNVPDGYLYCGSSFGQSAPNHLLIAPVKADNAVNAVLELGFLHDAGVECSELLERVSQTIGVALRSAKYRERLQELLEETQRQAEELSQQSDELRAANEELEQQSRALSASQERLERQQAELEQTNVVLEEQKRSLEAQRSDLERSQGTLQAQARELERASRYKTEFLANMSHELRTPLNSALIMARLLADNREGSLSAEQVRHAETIEAAGNDLLILINDILDLSKIEAGRIDIHPEPVAIAQITDKLERTFSSLAKQRGLDFRVELDKAVPKEIETDAQRLEQIVKNFISNALKFTEAGQITVAIHIVADGHIAFSVRDTGIGIPPEQQGIIFEAFRQADGTTNRKQGGTGLGLSISRELARMLGGAIELRSEVGQGSEFTLLLPQQYDPALVRGRSEPIVASAAPQRANGSAPRPAPARSLKEKPPSTTRPQEFEDDREKLTGDRRVILVVEDDTKFARVLYDLAQEKGFQCLVAHAADEGVALAREFVPHAVILDIGLPDHSGLLVLDRLKHNVQTRHIPVHVVSVHDYSQTALSLGAVGYMLKPVKREALEQALKGIEERLDHKVRRVLVVEDDPSQLESLKILLRSTGIDAVGVRSAKAALAQLRQLTFDCMVLDLTLPDVSGFDLLEELSQNGNRAFPPVIVYTGRELSPEDELQLRRYSKSIIVKGARSPERLLDEVTLFLHQVVADLPNEHQRMLAKAINRDGQLEAKRILIVEDDVRNVYALTSIFELQGSIVTIARNGREAITALERAEESNQRFDLILMDVMMPEMDGLTATREVRKRGEWADLPIIVLTAKAMPDDQSECLRAGANDYMAKPLDVEKLLSLARVWLSK